MSRIYSDAPSSNVVAYNVQDCVPLSSSPSSHRPSRGHLSFHPRSLAVYTSRQGRQVRRTRVR